MALRHIADMGYISATEFGMSSDANFTLLNAAFDPTANKIRVVTQGYSFGGATYAISLNTNPVSAVSDAWSEFPGFTSSPTSIARNDRSFPYDSGFDRYIPFISANNSWDIARYAIRDIVSDTTVATGANSITSGTAPVHAWWKIGDVDESVASVEDVYSKTMIADFGGSASYFRWLQPRAGFPNVDPGLAVVQTVQATTLFPGMVTNQYGCMSVYAKRLSPYTFMFVLGRYIASKTPHYAILKFNELNWLDTPEAILLNGVVDTPYSAGSFNDQYATPFLVSMGENVYLAMYPKNGSSGLFGARYGLYLETLYDDEHGVISPTKSNVSLSSAAARIGSSNPIQIAVTVLDGLGFPLVEGQSVRFFIDSISDPVSADDGALALTQDGPFIDGSGVPLSTDVTTTIGPGSQVSVWYLPPRSGDTPRLENIKVVSPA